MSMATRIAIMSQGKILQIGTPHEVYETPNCRFVADFIGSVSMFHGKMVEDEVDHCVIEAPECRLYVGHGISGVEGMDASVGIRPEKIALSFDLPEGVPAGAPNWVQGEVIELAYLGGYSVYHLKLATGMILKATVTNSVRHVGQQPKWGDTIWAHWSDRDTVVLTH